MSPRPGPARPVITMRLTQTGVDALNTRAREEHTTRSELIRRMLAYATRKMPRGWKP